MTNLCKYDSPMTKLRRSSAERRRDRLLIALLENLSRLICI